MSPIGEDFSDFDEFDNIHSPVKEPVKTLSRPAEPPLEQGEFSLVDVLKECFDAEPYKPQDAALAHLALTYARQIDEYGDLSKLGPSLLTALESLQMSPRARAMVKKGVTANVAAPKANPLDELRERRLRKNGA